MQRGVHRRFGALLVALLALALVIAVGAHAATGDLTFAQCVDDEDTNLEGAACVNAPGLDTAFSVAASGDGRSLYAASQGDDAVVRFNRDTTTGALTFAQCFDDEDEPGEGADCTDVPGLGGARSVAVSPDGRSLYAASSNDGAVVRFNRNATTGGLTFADCLEDDDSDSEGLSCIDVPGLGGATSVTASGNGRSVYAASTDDAIVRFNRNTTTGALTFAQCFDDEDTPPLESEPECLDIPGLGGAFSVTVSPDGKSLYTAAFTDGIVRFNRNTTTGALTFAQCFDDEDTNPEAAACTNTPGLGGARSVAVSPDGASLYAASNSDDAVVRFNRTTSGAVSFAQCFDDQDTNNEGATCPNAPGLDGAVSVAVSGDGESLYAASQDNDSIVRFARTATGAISFANCFDDEDTNLEGARCTNAPGLDGARSVAVSGDRKSLYAASQGDDAIVRFNRELPPPPADTPPSNEFSFEKVKKNKKRGTATLTVRIEEGPGELELAKTKKVKPAEKQPQAAGDVKLKVKPKGKAKKRLTRVRKGKQKATAKVRANVTYTPIGGEPNTKSKKVKLVKR